nr:MFS transporter [Candidatus Sigynarchaeota archaeon]
MTTPNEISKDTAFPQGKAVLFGLPRFSTSVLLGIESFAIFTLYVLGYGLDAGLTLFSIAAGYLSVAASQFLMGWLSDHVQTSLGHRKPFILIFAPLLAISFVFLILPRLVLPDLNDKASLFAWMLIWDVIFRASYGFTTPYQSWMAELFVTKDRPRVSQIQNVFNYIGNGLMALLSMLIFTQAATEIAADVNNIPAVLLWVTVIFAIILVAFYYLTAFFLPIEPKREIRNDTIQSLKIAVKNKNYLLITLMQGISGFGWSIMTTLMLTYTKLVLDLTTMEYLVVSVCLLLGIFIFLQVWRVFIERKGKKTMLLRVFLAGAIFMPVTFLGMIPMSSYLVIGIIFILGIGAILGGWYLFPYIIYADVAEDDDKGTGELRAGTYIGFSSIILNIFQAVAALLLSLVLALPPLAPMTYSFGYILWGPIVSIILLISWIFTKKFVTLDFAWESKR